MNNLPYTHLKFLDTAQSHYVYLASDLYKNFNNTNGVLSVYAGLYNNYTTYAHAGKISLYKDIVKQWFGTLDTSTQNDLKDIIKGENFHFYATMDAKKESKFSQKQYAFVRVLYSIVTQEESSSHTYGGSNKYFGSSSNVTPLKVTGHGGPDHRVPEDSEQ